MTSAVSTTTAPTAASVPLSPIADSAPVPNANTATAAMGSAVTP